MVRQKRTRDLAPLAMTDKKRHPSLPPLLPCLLRWVHNSLPRLPAGAPPGTSHPPSDKQAASPLLRRLFKAVQGHKEGLELGPWLEASMSSRCGGRPAGQAGVGRA